MVEVSTKLTEQLIKASSVRSGNSTLFCMQGKTSEGELITWVTNSVDTEALSAPADVVHNTIIVKGRLKK